MAQRSGLALDGSTGEGGGQLLRTALALAAVAGRRITVHDIRAGRSQPGLAPQHLAAARAVASACNGELLGDVLGSRRLTLEPGAPRAGSYRFDVAAERASAGAATLVLQAVAPVLAWADGVSEGTIGGGTHVPWSPPTQYTQGPLARALRGIGIELETHTERWGWYPRGGGRLAFRIRPTVAPRPVDWTERGALDRVTVLSAAGNLPASVARRQGLAAAERIRGALPGCAIDTEEIDAPGPGRGTVCIVQAEYDGGGSPPPPAAFSALGAPGKPAEQVGREAAAAFLEHHAAKGCIDVHLADQVLPYLALVDGASAFSAPEVTLHCRTAAWVCEQVLGASVEVDEGPPARITVRGVGTPPRIAG